jgi:hypothetical protein
MAAISTLITEIRTDISDDDSTRFTDAKILNVIKKAIRRANRIVQRNGLQFAKKKAALTTVANQAYLVLSTSITDFVVPIGLWRTDTDERIPFPTEGEWEEVISAAALTFALLDYQNDKIQFNGTPSTAIALNFWYYPTVDPSAYTTATSTPWSGRIDDIIMEYTINRLKNIDEMDLSYDTKLLTDMENQLLQAYAPNAPAVSEGKGWL